METVIIILLSILLIVAVVILFAVLSQKKGSGITKREAEDVVKGESEYQTRALQSSMNAANSTLLNAITMHTDTQGKSMDRFLTVVGGNLERQEKAQQEFVKSVEARLDAMKAGLEKTLGDVRRENTEQLDKMRHVVEEKMQETLNTRLSRRQVFH